MCHPRPGRMLTYLYAWGVESWAAVGGNVHRAADAAVRTAAEGGVRFVRQYLAPVVTGLPATSSPVGLCGLVRPVTPQHRRQLADTARARPGERRCPRRLRRRDQSGHGWMVPNTILVNGNWRVGQGAGAVATRARRSADRAKWLLGLRKEYSPSFTEKPCLVQCTGPGAPWSSRRTEARVSGSSALVPARSAPARRPTASSGTPNAGSRGNRREWGGPTRSLPSALPYGQSADQTVRRPAAGQSAGRPNQRRSTGRASSGASSGPRA